MQPQVKERLDDYLLHYFLLNKLSMIMQKKSPCSYLENGVPIYHPPLPNPVRILAVAAANREVVPHVWLSLLTFMGVLRTGK